MIGLATKTLALLMLDPNSLWYGIIGALISVLCGIVAHLYLRIIKSIEGLEGKIDESSEKSDDGREVTQDALAKTQTALASIQANIVANTKVLDKHEVRIDALQVDVTKNILDVWHLKNRDDI
jgi:hypothetical protein